MTEPTEEISFKTENVVSVLQSVDADSNHPIVGEIKSNSEEIKSHSEEIKSHSEEIRSNSQKSIAYSNHSIDSSRFSGSHPSLDQQDIESPKKGSIHMILGPMFSGKTGRLREKLKFYSSGANPMTCLLITSKTASEGSVASTENQQFTSLECFKLKEVMEDCRSFNVIAIDEAQFFPDIVEFCEELADKGKKVLVAALDGTFEREVFGEVLKLIPKAETVKKLRAKCHFCGKKASYSLRLSNETDLIVIGKCFYQAACRTCYSSEMSKKKSQNDEKSSKAFIGQHFDSSLAHSLEEIKEADI